MTGKKHIKIGVKALICVLIVSTTMVCTLSNNGWAMLAPAQNAAATDGQTYDRAADLKTVQTALESKIVHGRLKALGMTDKEIESRLSRLSNQQVHQLAKDISALNPGGGIVGLLELVILVLLIIFLANRL